MAQWFGVRTIHKHRKRGKRKHRRRGKWLYEERITVWKAKDLDEAIALAEDEAREYAEILRGGRYVGLAQAFHMLIGPPRSGSEVFSLIRASDLPSGEYLDRYFDDGNELQRQSQST